LKLVVLDPGLRTHSGHHLALDAAIVDFCAARGMSVELYAHRGVEDEVAARVGAISLFTHSVYAKNVTRGPQEGLLERDFALINERCYNDLCALSPDSFESDDVILVHSIRQNHLYGLARWLTGLSVERRPKCVVLHFLGNLVDATGQITPEAALLQRALWLLESLPAGAVVLAAPIPPACEELGRLTALPVQLHPIPLPGRHVGTSPTLRPAVKATSAQSRQLNFVFAGEARRDKGFHHFRAAMRLVLRDQPNVRFSVQAGGPTLPWWRGSRTRFSLWRLGSRVESHFGAMDEAAFGAFLQRADAIVLPYDPSHYRAMNSGVFNEALALGKPTVLPARTWMADEAKRLGAGSVAFLEWSPESIAYAMAQLAANIHDQTARSARASLTWNARHGIEPFMSFVLRA
jgi:hypothetical protein